MIVFKKTSKLMDSVYGFIGFFLPFDKFYDQFHTRKDYLNNLRIRNYLRTERLPVPWILAKGVTFVLNEGDMNSEGINLYLWYDNTWLVRDSKTNDVYTYWAHSPRMKKINNEITSLLKKHLRFYYPEAIKNGSFDLEFLKDMEKGQLDFARDVVPGTYPPDEDWAYQIRMALNIKDAVDEIDLVYA